MRIFRVMRFGQVAQLVEQRTENPRVDGSIPSLATICEPAFCLLPLLSVCSFFRCCV
ncbi:conserved hypothetical protein [Candidatus Competibacter denitrificans Run_A_D11]|uniref:Uncharacterized protein n=1 Tax=Candidatus Competibacter denitrificans Run_A_D11 TaxID=1400863 RepID=W6M800_9GAMM|nr:conserved hypothetical protein [Candidatus Competibacter denitrificans Run_A_D11]